MAAKKKKTDERDRSRMAPAIPRCCPDGDRVIEPRRLADAQLATMKFCDRCKERIAKARGPQLGRA